MTEEITWVEKINPFVSLDEKALKAYVEIIVNGGKFNHSKDGTTLSTVIIALEKAKVNYSLTAYPDIGYIVEGIKPVTQEEFKEKVLND